MTKENDKIEKIYITEDVTDVIKWINEETYNLFTKELMKNPDIKMDDCVSTVYDKIGKKMAIKFNGTARTNITDKQIVKLMHNAFKEGAKTALKDIFVSHGLDPSKFNIQVNLESCS